MQGQYFDIRTERQFIDLMAYLKTAMEKDGGLLLKTEPVTKRRTAKQQAAIEVYCRQVASALNDAGFDMVAVFKDMREGAQIPWSQSTVKDCIWRPVQTALTDKTSSATLSTAEVSQVYDVVNARVLGKKGLHVPFPEVPGA